MKHVPKFFKTGAIAASLTLYAAPSFSFGAPLPEPKTYLIAQSSNSISFRNSCSSPLEVAIYFKNLSGQWETKAWYSFSPDEKARLTGVDTRNRYLYYYAKATDGSGKVWSGNDTRQPISGRLYDMKKFDIGPRTVDYTHTLTCPAEQTTASDRELEALEGEVNSAKSALAPGFGLHATQLSEAQICAATARLVTTQHNLISSYRRRLGESPTPRPVAGQDCARDERVSQEQDRLIALYKRRLAR
jgi:uncharacterized membrane protein